MQVWCSRCFTKKKSRSRQNKLTKQYKNIILYRHEITEPESIEKSRGTVSISMCALLMSAGVMKQTQESANRRTSDDEPKPVTASGAKTIPPQPCNTLHTVMVYSGSILPDTCAVYQTGCRSQQCWHKPPTVCENLMGLNPNMPFFNVCKTRQR